MTKKIASILIFAVLLIGLTLFFNVYDILPYFNSVQLEIFYLIIILIVGMLFAYIFLK